MKYSNKGINYISCENKISTDKITEIQHTANDILFKIQNTHIMPLLTHMAYENLKFCWLDLNSLQVTNQKALPKKKELLKKLQEQILILRGLFGTNSTKEELQSVINYHLSRAINFKVDGKNSPQEIVEKIIELRDLKFNLGNDYADLNTTQFEKIIAELKELLMKKLN